MAMTHVLLNNRVNSTRCQYELVLGFCLTVPSFLGNRAEGEHLAVRYNDRRARASLLPALLSRNSSKLQDANCIESRKHYSQHRFFLPIGSMYAIYGNIDHQYTPNVSIYTIHGSYGLYRAVYHSITVETFLGETTH